MASKITDDKQKLIRKRALQGHSVVDIAEEVGLSEKTVRKYIKNAPRTVANAASAEDDIQHIDYTTVLTKKEEQIVTKIKKEIALYEDDIEGWSYHLTKNDDRIRQQGLWWSFIVYPESAPDKWLDRLRATGMQIAISPLHDKDWWEHDSPEMVNAETGEIIPVGARYKKGDRKKAHWHCIAKSDKKTSWREMNELLQGITHCPYIQKCRSLKNAFDYFLHINDSKKYQGYFKDEIIRMNGFVIEPTKFEQGILFDEILQTIIKSGYMRWLDVIKHYQGQPEYILMLSSRPAIVTELLKDMWREHNPDGRVQKIEIVNETIKTRKEV